ncbi:hypothetical protein BJY04DRAFT_191018 [Aspergillus karnatakaensis]|uniref:uncharacterized protein n=1 Tax=Aspergillus karnatakaensis TaxID=1810916 RepID=UPI003CCCA28A
MILPGAFLFSVSCAGALANALAIAPPLEIRQEAPAIADTFNLYAYGEGISGLEVFYADGKAQIGDPTLSTAEVVQPVFFTTSPTSTPTFLAHPKKPTSPGADFETLLFTLPTSNSTDHAVLFTELPASGSGTTPITETPSQFNTYGNYIIIEAENANFYAAKTKNEGVWNLLWSEDSGEVLDTVAVTLRTIKPVTETVF